MNPTTRRSHLQQWLALGAAPVVPLPAFATLRRGLAEARFAGAGEKPDTTDTVVPPQGIGRGIRHLAYSDLGGRPDSVQIMMNRQHLYVGHMFSNGLTVLDASDPRRLRPVFFFTGGDETR